MGWRTRTTIGLALGLAVTLTSIAPLAAVPPPDPAADAALLAGTPVGTVERFGFTVDGPEGAVVGPDGAVWFRNGLQSLGRITTDGVVRTFRYGGDAAAIDLTSGPDGALWFTVAASHDIWRMTTDGDVTTFGTTATSRPSDLVAGPDGAIWFTDSTTDAVGRLTTSGHLDLFAGPALVDPLGITAGPDGNLWFTGGQQVRRITPAGVVTTFTDPALSPTGDIAVGPDGNVWFTSGARSVGRITPAGSISVFGNVVADFVRALAAGPDGNVWFTADTSIGSITPAGEVAVLDLDDVRPDGIVTGSDGNVWFTDWEHDTVGRLSTGGTLTRFPGVDAVDATDLAIGADGNMWFTALGSSTIARITSTGEVTSFADPRLLAPIGITAGSDGALWFTDLAADAIGRITTAGAITLFTGPEIEQPGSITTGGDGNVWFTMSASEAIGRITPSGAVTTFTHPDLLGATIAPAPDGSVWFANYPRDAIGRIALDGEVTSYPGVGRPGALAAGPDGSMWYSTASDPTSISRISPSGAISSFADPTIDRPGDLAAGPDGAVWFVNRASYELGRMSIDGTVELVPRPSPRQVWDVEAGPDGHVWFTEGVDAVGRVRAVEAGAPTFVHATGGTAKATLSWDAPPESSGPIGGYEVLDLTGTRSCTTTGARSCAVIGLTPGLPSTPFTFRVRTTGPGGPGPWSAPSNPVTTWSGSGYHAVVPARILDSRLNGVGFSGRVVAGSPRAPQVTGRGGPSNVPPTATAVVMNVTVTDSTAESFVTVSPSGSPTPTTSNVNVGTGQVIPNLVTVKVGTGGRVDIATAVGSTNVVADLVGWYDDGDGGGDRFNPIAPVRLLDSRTATGGWGGNLVAGSPRDLVVRRPNRSDGVPPTATAVIANVTVTSGSAPSFVAVWPAGGPQPNVSNLNLLPGQTIPNLAIVKIGAGGSIRFATAAGSVDVVVDVVGYFDPTIGSRFHAMAPTRVLDTRIGLGLSGPQGPGQTRGLLVPGQPTTGVPAWSTGLVANVTVADASAESFVAVFPGNGPRPIPFSTLNFGRNQVVANLAVTGLGQFGAMNLYNHVGSTALIADVVGFYAPI